MALGAPPRALTEVLSGADLPGFRRVLGDPSTTVRDITHDSRQVTAGSMFCAVVGARHDGHTHAEAAVASGATALLVQTELDLGVTQVVVDDSRAAMGPLAASFHHHPSRTVRVCAVTGTNGKTTTCHMLSWVLASAGRSTSVIGTLSGARTTPEATDLQRELAALRDRGVTDVAMEATSIGLELHRMDGVEAEVAVFTNLSRDHLDVHGNMTRYFAAKQILFAKGRARAGVVNSDDPYGRLLLDAARIPMTPWSMREIEVVSLEPVRTVMRWKGRQIVLPLGGRFNAANALAAATTARVLGLDADDIAHALQTVPPVPGRFEPIAAGQDFAVIVDYAHTPDGLAVALEAARAVAPTTGRVIVVFGCGGDRDATKRPMMGTVAVRGADLVVVTSDNPRGEDPAAIIDDVVSALTPSERRDLRIEPDRAAAIALALAVARPADVVLIAGKGHETTQSIAGIDHPFDDRVVARELLTVGRGR